MKSLLISCHLTANILAFSSVLFDFVFKNRRGPHPMLFSCSRTVKWNRLEMIFYRISNMCY